MIRIYLEYILIILEIICILEDTFKLLYILYTYYSLVEIMIYLIYIIKLIT